MDIKTLMIGIGNDTAIYRVRKSSETVPSGELVQHIEQVAENSFRITLLRSIIFATSNQFIIERIESEEK